MIDQSGPTPRLIRVFAGQTCHFISFAILRVIFLFPGKADCPYFARAELLGDKLNINLPDFKLHKIIKRPEEWQVSTFYN